ncbi:MAG: DUF938 domain-containing protein [Colwellia sp.]
MTKPFSQACENNKHPILEVLKSALTNYKHVLEIGSGTGQHAVYFAEKLPYLTWQTSDLPVNHDGINQWIDDQNLQNINRPININLAFQNCSFENDLDKFYKVDAIYTANTLHIVCWEYVENLFKLAEQILPIDGLFCIYGPFKYQGEFTSDSNANFDIWLKDRDALSGVRDFEKVTSFAEKCHFTLVNDFEMPANNRFLLFKKAVKHL